MRSPLFALGIAVTMACGGGDGSSDPLAPQVENLSLGGNGTVAAKKDAVELPFRGSFTGLSSSTEVVPPSHTVTGTADGTATHLGRFTTTSVDVVFLATGSSTGNWNFTAANGDQLFTTTAGAADEFTPPNISHVTLVATIVGGTGRFVAATGTFTLEQTSIIDFATATASVSGSFDGSISRSK